MSDTVDVDDDVEEDRLLQNLISQTAVGLLAMMGGIVVAGLFLREPVTAIAISVVDILGSLGVFLGVLASDAFGMPVPPSAYIFAGVAAESPMTSLLFITIITSVAGASLGYVLGPYIGKIPFLHRRLERFRRRGESLFAKWGIWTVGIAAITPLPFAFFCWLAGIYRMPYGYFFAATLVRGPRILGYYGLFLLGWASLG